jgi:prolyl-tRNA synthetase
LGQNFAKAYGVTFLGRDGKEDYAYATSWGASTRLVGGVVMTHGDDKGLRLPPRLAPIQVVIVPIYSSDAERSSVLEICQRLTRDLRQLRVKLDDREEHRPGYKFNEWELKGVPVRLEVGPREVEQEQAVIFRRDTEEKRTARLEELEKLIPRLLDEIQKELYDQAHRFREEHTFTPADYDELKTLAEEPGGFLITGWCGETSCEDKVKAETKADIRLLPLDPEEPPPNCIVCGSDAKEIAIWAQAY